MSTEKPPAKKAPVSPAPDQPAPSEPLKGEVPTAIEWDQPPQSIPVWNPSKEELFCSPGVIDPEIYPVTMFHEELALPEVARVATVAAILLKDGRTPVDAVQKAYELLELSAGGWLGITKPEHESFGSFELGIEFALDERKKELKKCNDWKNVPKGCFVIGPDGNTKPVSFELALSKRLSKGYGKNKGRQEEIFRGWCANFLEISPEKTATLIEDWKKNGMPVLLFRQFWTGFKEWNAQKTSKVRSVAKKESIAKKKALEVLKRKSRPPVDRLVPIVKKGFDAIKAEKLEKKSLT